MNRKGIRFTIQITCKQGLTKIGEVILMPNIKSKRQRERERESRRRRRSYLGSVESLFGLGESESLLFLIYRYCRHHFNTSA